MSEITSIDSLGKIDVVINEFVKTSDREILLYIAEGEYIDFKLKYDILDEMSRYELSKDVSSFLNSNGGYIIIGIGTEQDDVSKLEYSKTINTIEDISNKIIGILKEYIYPNPMKYVDVSFNGNSNLGINIIKILPSEELHLIIRQFEEGNKIKQSVFGYVQRKGDSSVPLTKEAIHSRFKLGSGDIRQNISLILELLTDGSNKVANNKSEDSINRLNGYFKEITENE